ncbi:MAG: hypothetical protein ABSG41_25960 [Bryobacteraceae bacterium]|jgi:hypothetical protein
MKPSIRPDQQSEIVILFVRARSRNINIEDALRVFEEKIHVGRVPRRTYLFFSQKRKGRCPAPPHSKGTLHRRGLALDSAATRFARVS